MEDVLDRLYCPRCLLVFDTHDADVTQLINGEMHHVCPRCWNRKRSIWVNAERRED